MAETKHLDTSTKSVNVLGVLIQWTDADGVKHSVVKDMNGLKFPYGNDIVQAMAEGRITDAEFHARLVSVDYSKEEK